MQIEKYCLIAFVNEELSKILKDEIYSISNEIPKYSYIKNNFFITFSSAFELCEIENLLSEHNGLVFFLFKNDDNLIYNLPNRVKKHLFGELLVEGKKVYEVKVKLNIPIQYIDVSINLPDLENFSQDEKIKFIDEILDKGCENITQEEKDFLNSLFKNNKEEIINQ